jgi:ubiquinone/menaquinone biosynthesis C-methylase UbiE
MTDKVELPYFDMLFEALKRQRPGLSATFGHHVHWGYWGPSDKPDGTMEDFAAAAERLTRYLLDIAGVRDGQRVLDAGCGLGGTIASLNERHSGVVLTGLNIDPRQVEHARERVAARPGNEVSFCVGDACNMPLPSASFDHVLAVECIFHFPDRKRFFAEARRVLKPGGRLTLCDFVPRFYLLPSLTIAKRYFSSHIEAATGPIDIRCTAARYRALARASGFIQTHEEDITEGTLPTYPVLRKLIKETGAPVLIGHAWVSALQTVSRLNALRYMMLSFTAR